MGVAVSYGRVPTVPYATTAFSVTTITVYSFLHYRLRVFPVLLTPRCDAIITDLPPAPPFTDVPLRLPYHGTFFVCGLPRLFCATCFTVTTVSGLPRFWRANFYRPRCSALRLLNDAFVCRANLDSRSFLRRNRSRPLSRLNSFHTFLDTTVVRCTPYREFCTFSCRTTYPR